MPYIKLIKKLRTWLGIYIHNQSRCFQRHLISIGFSQQISIQPPVSLKPKVLMIIMKI